MSDAEQKLWEAERRILALESAIRADLAEAQEACDEADGCFWRDACPLRALAHSRAALGDTGAAEE